jgi:hypothetical protein
MTAVLSGRSFGWQVVLRIGIFLTFLIGLPLTLYVLDRLNGAEDVAGEAVSLVTATPFGFLLFLLLVASLVRPSWRRMKALGLPGWSGLIVPWLLFADITYIVSSQGGLGFSSSTLDGRIPLYAITALGLILAMVCARPPAEASDGFLRLGLAGRIAAILIALIVLRILFDFGMARWLHSVLLQPEDYAPPAAFTILMRSSYWTYMIGPYICLMLLGVVSWCVILSRRAPHQVTAPNPPE